MEQAAQVPTADDVPRASAGTKTPAASRPWGTHTTASRSWKGLPPPQAAVRSPGVRFLSPTRIGLQESHQRGTFSSRAAKRNLCMLTASRKSRMPNRRHPSCEFAGTYRGRHRSQAIALQGAMYVSTISLMSEALKECRVPALQSKRELTTARATATLPFLERRL